MSSETNFLDCLISAANEQAPKLKLIPLEDLDNNSDNKDDVPLTTQSEICTGDSSDDEQSRNHESNYNQFGKDIKHLLKASKIQQNHDETTGWKSNKFAPTSTTQKPADVYTDPIFGIRITKPLVSSAVLQERMQGREAVSLMKLKYFVGKLTSEKNWVIAGVIVHKSNMLTSQKGSQYTLWTISDLKDDLKTVTLFLFGKACQSLWKMTVGTVVGVLNPTVMEKNDRSRDLPSLSINNAEKVMVFGQSKDLGTCKSLKKNGEKCTSFVNLNKCEYCLYHIRNEYQKYARRSEFQSKVTHGGLTALRNKVLGKNEVFYAGKSYTAIKATKTQTQITKDQNILKQLQGVTVNSNSLVQAKNLNSTKTQAAHLEFSNKQRRLDLERLKKLKATQENQDFSKTVTLDESKELALQVIADLKSKTSTVKNVPTLGAKKEIDLNAAVSKRHVNRAKMNALKWVELNGPIKKKDPMKTKGTNRKRVLENVEKTEPASKVTKIDNPFVSDRFRKMLEASSKHNDLLEQKDNEAQEKYFAVLEKKEMLEEKMLGTYKVPCKAVQCLKCKYTYFSAADLCKTERHPLRVYDSFKRFFKCGNCSNRTVCLEIVPLSKCKTCGSGRWERTSMMKERKVNVAPVLSIRGGEQKFVNSNVDNGSLDLMVADD